jgi:hypothetical protein
MSVRPTRVANSGEESHSPYAAIQERYRWNSEQWEPKHARTDGIDAADWWKRNDETIAAKADDVRRHTKGAYGMPVQCAETGVIFPTALEAANHVGVTSFKIVRALQNGNTAAGLHWCRPGAQVVKHRRVHKQVRCIDTGETFPSMQVAAETYHVHVNTFKHRMHNYGGIIAGMRWEFIKTGNGATEWNHIQTAGT